MPYNQVNTAHVLLYLPLDGNLLDLYATMWFLARDQVCLPAVVARHNRHGFAPAMRFEMFRGDAFCHQILAYCPRPLFVQPLPVFEGAPAVWVTHDIDVGDGGIGRQRSRYIVQSRLGRDEARTVELEQPVADNATFSKRGADGGAGLLKAQLMPTVT